ncbi:unnamed protein product [Ambrosiozyma monospora]|uniref:Unnamed protein product n=1 Tax=Ambrosiozyma monospora TaxID=43982 RepID=A0A9W6SYI0_AMBMO|nr:unnamed protein product [Ambrosiozyma monospora]
MKSPRKPLMSSNRQIPPIVAESKILSNLFSHSKLFTSDKSKKDISEKMKLPLTEQSLKPFSIPFMKPSGELLFTENSTINSSNNALTSATIKVGSKRKFSSENPFGSKKHQSVKSGLKEIAVNHNKLNVHQQHPHQLKPSKCLTTSLAPSSASAYDSHKSNKKSLQVSKSLNTNNILPDKIPEITSDNEEEDASKLADWGSKSKITELLVKQRHTNPDDVFGMLRKVDVNRIFQKKYLSDFNIDFQESDKLTLKECEDYNKQNGYTG